MRKKRDLSPEVITLLMIVAQIIIRITSTGKA